MWDHCSHSDLAASCFQYCTNQQFKILFFGFMTVKKPFPIPFVAHLTTETIYNPSCDFTNQRHMYGLYYVQFKIHWPLRVSPDGLAAVNRWSPGPHPGRDATFSCDLGLSGNTQRNESFSLELYSSSVHVGREHHKIVRPDKSLVWPSVGNLSTE